MAMDDKPEKRTQKHPFFTILVLCLPLLCLPLGVAYQRGYFGDPTEVLASAVAYGDANKVRVAIKRGADVNASPELLGGMHPLTLAAFDGHADMVKLLIEAGAEVNDRNNEYAGIQALDMALTAPRRYAPERRQDYETTIHLLRAAGAKTNQELSKARHGMNTKGKIAPNISGSAP
ncbi:MAG: ankyrin repeat domain-containing protein [Abitibacteriaceae bacterium]|nr:ankyrin repeat domain-containing protein [Abditibacteriaceae bacterium]MBV9863924.1 ankyrin repeat domain-containing protein [Abditibacteriaceae bacterium]